MASLNPVLDETQHCPRCGATPAKDPPRCLRCDECGFVMFFNPKPVAAAIPRTPDGGIVLLKRGFNPGKDLWTFPGGFIDLGESVEQAAMRETQEEICVEVAITKLVGVYSRPTDRVMLVVYEGTITEEPRTTDEAPTVETFQARDLPWDDMAFWSTTQALRDLLT